VNAAVRCALDSSRTVTITTTGRRTGQPRTVSVWLQRVDGRIYLSGLPGKRDWVANLKADPRFTVGFREHSGLRASARAWPVDDAGERRRVLTAIGRPEGIRDVEALISGSPLVEFTIDD
jgi:deazaflavin-dependent oxidoreductase (nitroreductase family)